MNRRTFLRRLGAVPALSGVAPWLGRLAGIPAAPVGAAPFRRVRPSDPDWPSEAAWDTLKEQVGGRLAPVVSPLAPCVSTPGSAACDTRLEEMKNPYFIGDQAGGTQLSGWLGAWTSSPSAYVVTAKTSADIVAAVNFAREHRLRLVVKGGGHSYLGNSNAPDSLLVWTHEMRSIALHDAFVPQGCKTAPIPAVTIEPGARWLEAYDAVTTKGGRYVQGGGCCTVGVIGLLSGGGFGSFSKYYGSAAAYLLEAEVVTADGRLLTANACSHPDLFWALKGGGGGTFGIVTGVTLATHPLPEIFGAVSGKIRARSDAAFRKLIAEFLRFYQKSLFNPHWGEQVHFEKDNTLEIHMLVAGLSDEDAEKTWDPFRQLVAGSPAEFQILEPIRVGTTSARNWWDTEWRRKHTPDSMASDPRPGAPASNMWWSDNTGECNAYLYAYESLWLPQSLLLDPGKLASAVFDASRHFEVQFHINKGLAGAPPTAIAAARDTATNPAVLDAFTLVIIATGAPQTNPGVPGREPDLVRGKADAEAITAAADALRALVPDAGSYANESNYFERNFQKSYWGTEHYARLSEVKKQYDPDGLFFVHNGVGSEDWSADGFTRRA
ncbi:MAG TPA: FAD-binding protein [Thermoanaerobaculia bacterium]|nr:FAD-binding protein [Thermoanaerobaculia bacterium]